MEFCISFSNSQIADWQVFLCLKQMVVFWVRNLGGWQGKSSFWSSSSGSSADIRGNNFQYIIIIKLYWGWDLQGVGGKNGGVGESKILGYDGLQLQMNRLNLLKEVISGQGKYSYTKVEVTRGDEVATIWLNSPKDLNSLSQAMINDIMHAVTELNHELPIKVIVIRSKHDKAFCAGANLKQMVANDLSSYPQSIHFRVVSTLFRQYHKPIIAVVEGKALGGGFELALLCDIILCSEKASFGLPEITLGLIPGMGGTQVLPRIVGEKVAQRMILTGLPINAQEAHRLNIAHLLPTDNFDAKVNEIVNAVASKSRDSLISAKRAVKNAFDTTLDQGLQHEQSIFQSLFNKKGPKQGITAFLQKRKANFKGI